MLASMGRRRVHRRRTAGHRGPGRHRHPTPVRMRWLQRWHPPPRTAPEEVGGDVTDHGRAGGIRGDLPKRRSRW